MSLWDQVKESLVELYSVAADKTGEAAKVGLRRYDKMGISWDVKRLMTDLGGLVYHAISEGRDDIVKDPAVIDIVEQIKGLEKELQQKEQEIVEIKQRRVDPGKQTSAAVTVDEATDSTLTTLPSGELASPEAPAPGEGLGELETAGVELDQITDPVEKTLEEQENQEDQATVSGTSDETEVQPAPSDDSKE